MISGQADTQEDLPRMNEDVELEERQHLAVIGKQSRLYVDQILKDSMVAVTSNIHNIDVHVCINLL